MGVAKLTVYDWREIMRVCGNVVSNYETDRVELRYIDLCFRIPSNPINADECVAYAGNGYQASRLVVMSHNKDIPDSYHLLIPPMKTPARTRTVEIYIDDEKREYEVVFVDEDGDVLSAAKSPFADCQPMNYEAFFKNSHERIESYNYGTGKYHIVLNPKYLLNALEGMKSCESVILNFGGQTDAVSIRPFDGDISAEALVLPIRTLQ